MYYIFSYSVTPGPSGVSSHSIFLGRSVGIFLEGSPGLCVITGLSGSSAVTSNCCTLPPTELSLPAMLSLTASRYLFAVALNMVGWSQAYELPMAFTLSLTAASCQIMHQPRWEEWKEHYRQHYSPRPEHRCQQSCCPQLYCFRLFHSSRRWHIIWLQHDLPCCCLRGGISSISGLLTKLPRYKQATK